MRLAVVMFLVTIGGASWFAYAQIKGSDES
jgi:hypothetical protein